MKVRTVATMVEQKSFDDRTMKRNATILHLLGIDHTKLTFRHGGRDQRLTDVHGKVMKELLA